MSEIQFNQEEKDVLTQKLKAYCDKELGQAIGQFEAEFFLDFISAEIGAFYYNKGLHEAEAVFRTKVEEVADALYDIELPTHFKNTSY